MTSGFYGLHRKAFLTLIVKKISLCFLLLLSYIFNIGLLIYLEHAFGWRDALLPQVNSRVSVLGAALRV